jgi:hypothetical protein
MEPTPTTDTVIGLSAALEQEEAESLFFQTIIDSTLGHRNQEIARASFASQEVRDTFLNLCTLKESFQSDPDGSVEQLIVSAVSQGVDPNHATALSRAVVYTINSGFCPTFP